MNKFRTKRKLFPKGGKKTLLIMKLTSMLLLLALLEVSAKGYSQEIKFRSQEDITIKDLFSSIEEQSDYTIFYKDGQVDIDRKVKVDSNRSDIKEILSSVLAEDNCTYKISDKLIVIYPEASSSQQQKVVTGVVKDSDGETIPGATVMLKSNPSKGVVVDNSGKFSIEANKGEVLIVSFMGMKDSEITVGDASTISVVLEIDSYGLDEVVAIGYGTQKKSDLTGAVSSVSSKDLVKVAVPSVGHALAGKAAGLSVSQSSAQPGGGLDWQIRGSATGRSPLIIVDGFPITSKDDASSGNRYSSGSKSTTLNTINPNDIESVEVLKDASATAIYGSRAAGGVIIITTKRGANGAVSVDYRGSYSYQNLYNLPTMLAPKDFMKVRNEVTQELYMHDNGIAPFGDNSLPDDYAPVYSDTEIANFNGGTDWLDEIMRAGGINQHNLTITSGTDKMKYLISLSTFSQDGVVETNDFKRKTGRINIDQKITDWLKVGISSSYSVIDENNVPLGDGMNEGSGIIRSALQFNPLLPVRDDNGDYSLDPGQAFIPNPVSLLEIEDVSKNEDLFANSFVEITPIEGLFIKFSAGLNRNWSWRDTYLPTSTLYGQMENGLASKSYGGKMDYLINGIAQYSRTFDDKHSLSVMGGYEYQEFVWEGFNASNNQFPYDGIKWYNLGLGEKERPEVGSYGGRSELASYIGRVNYTYNDKYLLTANLRVDGSSNFAENNQWGVFSGFSLAWRVTEEPFMSNLDAISNLKLRVGYGQTGNDDISGADTYYSPGWNYAFNSKSSSGIGLASLGNPDIKWETQTDLNIGLDFGFLNNKITGSLELYNRVISDLLGDKDLMSYHAITSIKSNLDSEKQSRGFDFQLSTVNMDRGEFSWNSDLTVTYYRDSWKKRDSSWKPDINGEEKEIWGAVWTTLSDGLVQVGDDLEHMPDSYLGVIKIQDVNGYLVDGAGDRVLDADGKPQYSGEADGKIDNADQVKAGYDVPLPIGFNNTFKYKNFDVTLFLHTVLNNYAYNSNRTTYGGEIYRIKDGTNLIDEVKDRWSYNNQEGDFPSAFQGYSQYGHGDFFLEKAWFVRVKNLSFGYSLPEHLRPAGVKKIRFFADAQNLYVFTPFTGMDPETGGGVSYPNQRTFTGGIEVKF